MHSCPLQVFTISKVTSVFYHLRITALLRTGMDLSGLEVSQVEGCIVSMGMI
jgi:hypothetical protein